MTSNPTIKAESTDKLRSVEIEYLPVKENGEQLLKVTMTRVVDKHKGEVSRQEKLWTKETLELLVRAFDDGDSLLKNLRSTDYESRSIYEKNC